MDRQASSTLSALVVDDSRSVRELLVAMLEELGVGTVLQAAEGAEEGEEAGGVEGVRERAPDAE